MTNQKTCWHVSSIHYWGQNNPYFNIPEVVHRFAQTTTHLFEFNIKDAYNPPRSFEEICAEWDNSDDIICFYRLGEKARLYLHKDIGGFDLFFTDLEWLGRKAKKTLNDLEMVERENKIFLALPRMDNSKELKDLLLKKYPEKQVKLEKEEPGYYGISPFKKVLKENKPFKYRLTEIKTTTGDGTIYEVYTKKWEIVEQKEFKTLPEAEAYMQMKIEELSD